MSFLTHDSANCPSDDISIIATEPLHVEAIVKVGKRPWGVAALAVKCFTLPDPRAWSLGIWEKGGRHKELLLAMREIKVPLAFPYIEVAGISLFNLIRTVCDVTNISSIVRDANIVNIFL
jgi:YVTN family beta-propeller protein